MLPEKVRKVWLSGMMLVRYPRYYGMIRKPSTVNSPVWWQRPFPLHLSLAGNNERNVHTYHNYKTRNYFPCPSFLTRSIYIHERYLARRSLWHLTSRVCPSVNEYAKWWKTADDHQRNADQPTGENMTKDRLQKYRSAGERSVSKWDRSAKERDYGKWSAAKGTTNGVQ